MFRFRSVSPSRQLVFLGLLVGAAGCAVNAFTPGANDEGCVGADCAREPEAQEPDDENEAVDPKADAGTKKDGGQDAGKADAGRSDAGKKDGGKGDAGGKNDSGASSTEAGAPDASSPTSVGGATVAECQGQTTLAVDFNGAHPAVQSGFAIYSGGQHEVYAYSRATVTDYAYGGTAGETKIRLLLPRVTGPGQYQGMMGVFKWDAALGGWSNYATPTQTVVVTIAGYNVVMPTGLMCNGTFVGRAEALFSPNTVAVFDFAVPLLTPSFPKSNPGPP